MKIEDITEIRNNVGRGSAHPLEVKKSLAYEITERFHGPGAAKSAQDYFETRPQKRSVPKNIRKRFSPPERVWICELLVDLRFARSRGDARRLITQRAVKVDGKVVADVDFEFQRKVHRVIEVGKSRIAQVESETRSNFDTLLS
jgi:tyrosyl-tRNA synthetase